MLNYVRVVDSEMEPSHMSPHVQLAQQFGELIAKEDYKAAHTLLTTEAQKTNSVKEMKRRFKGMRSYAPGPITNVLVMKEFVLEDWPAKQNGDVASIYVSLDGDSFCEAVSVIVTVQAGQLRIRDIEWGRP